MIEFLNFQFIFTIVFDDFVFPLFYLLYFFSDCTNGNLLRLYLIQQFLDSGLLQNKRQEEYNLKNNTQQTL